MFAKLSNKYNSLISVISLAGIVFFSFYLAIRYLTVVELPNLLWRGDIMSFIIIILFFSLIRVSTSNSKYKKQILKWFFYLGIILLIWDILWDNSINLFRGPEFHRNMALDLLLIFFSFFIIHSQFPKFLRKMIEQLKKARLIYCAICLLLIALYSVVSLSEINFYLDENTLLLPLFIFSALSLFFYFSELEDFINKNKNKTIFWLVLIITLGLIIRIIGAVISNANLDEGNWIYDPWMISLGKIPFYDFNSREPFFFYFMAPFVKVLGTKLLYNRLVTVVISVINIIVIYLLGKKIHSKKLGLVAAAIFSLTPYAVFASYDVGSGPLFYLITSLFFYGILCLIEKPKWWLTILLGLTLGASVHISRLAIFFYASVPLVFIFSFLPKYKTIKTYGHFIVMWLSSAFGLLPIMVYYIKLVGLDEFDVLYGFRVLVLGFVSGIIFFISYHLFYKFIYKNKNLWHLKKIGITICLILFSIYSYYNIGIEPRFKIKIIYNIFLQALIYLGPLMLFFSLLIKTNINNKINKFIILPILFLVYFVLYQGRQVIPQAETFGLRVIPDSFHLIFWIIFSLFWFSSLIIIFKEDIKIKICKESLWWPVLFLFLTPIIFYLIHVQLSVSLFKSFMAGGALFAGLAIIKLWEIKSEYLKTGILTLLIISIGFSMLFYMQTPLRDRMWKQSDIQKIVTYLEENTTKNERIFTAGTIFSTESNRRIVFDISHPLMYGTNEVDMPDLSWIEHLPTAQELADHMKRDVNIIVMDHRTLSIFKNNTAFKKLLDDGIFVADEKINNSIRIYRKY